MRKLACVKANNVCEGCFYADECDFYLANGGNHIPAIEVDHASMALCGGRHPIPQAEDGSIFEKELNPLDVLGMEETALRKLEDLSIKSLDLYVTGLTVALVAVLNATRRLGIDVTLYHYNRETNTYYPQKVS